MSLIFAVFLTNPAPICVLDEVDAPLDDANVERYCDLLDEMARNTDTRFVVITHNPITMARMNRLFGVTMAERGCLAARFGGFGDRGTIPGKCLGRQPNRTPS
jgi:chromosome segregation protein